MARRTRLTAPRTKQRIGDYQGKNDWTGYWQTSVSDVALEVLNVRGYPVDELVANLSYTDVLYLTIRGELPNPQQRRVLDACLTAMPDHALLSTHAGAARFVASGWPSSPVPAIAAGLLCIGEVTISPQESAEVIQDGLARMRERAITPEEAAQEIVEEHFSARHLVPGFGHPQHKHVDIRAAAVRNVVEKEGLFLEGWRFYDAVHKAVVERKETFLPMNIDGAIACAYTDLGFTPLEMPGLAGIAIMPGIIAHVVEEIESGVPLRVIPHGQYTGVPIRHMNGVGMYGIHPKPEP
jgi:citrate synthase